MAESLNSSRMMDKFLWQLTIKNNLLLLRLAGFWPKGKTTYKIDFYLLQAIVFLSLFLISDVLFQAIKIFFILDNLEAVTGIIFILLTKALGIVKVYFFIKNLPDIKHLMVILESDIFKPKNSRQIQMVEPSLKAWIFLFRIIWSAGCSAIVFWGLFPLLGHGYKQHRLPFLAWHPFRTNSSPFYEITYVYQIISVTYNAFCNINFDTLIAALNTYAGIQFDLLCDNLKNIKIDGDWTDGVNNQLLKCIDHHKTIIKFADISSQFSSWIILFQFLTGGTTIALTMFQLTIVAPFSSEFYCLLFFESAIVVQIFSYCWFGNQVHLKSDNLTSAIFQSDWIYFPLAVQKKMLFFMVKCHKPMQVSALNLFYLSLETFVRIMRTAWSYFALLHQLSA